MTEGDDCDDEDVVVDRVDYAVVADADSQTGTSVSGTVSGTGWYRMSCT